MRPHLPIAFASLLLSIMLWFVVYAQNVPDPRPVNAPLAIDGLDDSRFFLQKVPSDVRLIVNAPADRAKDLAEERVTASVDLSAPTTGAHDYPVAVSPDWVRRYLEDPHPTVRILIEPMANRILRINRVVKGSLRDSSLRLTQSQLAPTMVTVRGPESEVSSVQEVRAYLDLTAIDPLNQEAQESELIPIDRAGSRPQHVRMTPSMAVNTFKLIPAEATKPAQVVPDIQVSYDPAVLPDGWRTDPTTVTLSGKPDVLANVSKVPTAIVQARGLDRTRTFHVRLIAPKGTAIIEAPEVDVTVLTRPAPRTIVIDPPASVPAPTTNGTPPRSR